MLETEASSPLVAPADSSVRASSTSLPYIPSFSAYLPQSTPQPTLSPRRSLVSLEPELPSRGSPETSKSFTSALSDVATLPYLRLKAQKIEKDASGNLSGEQVEVTPCHCDHEDRHFLPPSWSLKAASFMAQRERYLILRDPHLLIAGIPVGFVPELIFPLKNQPQSGMLSPELLWDSRFGYTVSPSLYLYFSPYADTTITPEIFLGPGELRLRGEHRAVDSSTGLLQVNWEVMQDRRWLESGALKERRRREWFGDELTSEPGQCARPTSELEKEFCNTLWAALQRGREKLRGKISYSSRKDLAPRLSVMARGEVYSDHRYAEDLEVSRWPAGGFSRREHSAVKSFAANRYRLAYRGRPLSLSIDGLLGDHFLMRSPFLGLQNPVSIVTETPMYHLAHTSWLTLYMRSTLKYKWIGERTDSITEIYPTENTAPPYLSSVGRGDWTAWSLDFYAPFSVHRHLVSYVLLSGEHRYVRPVKAAITDTHLVSPRAELSLSVPLRGVMGVGRLPGLDLFNLGDPYYLRSDLGHRFDVGIKLSLRPVVWREGNYGESSSSLWPSRRPAYEGQTYFAEDLESAGDEEFVRGRRGFFPHKILTLFMRHKFNLTHEFAEKSVRISGDRNRRDAETIKESHNNTEALSPRQLSEEMVAGALSLDQPTGKAYDQWASSYTRDYPLEIDVAFDYDLDGPPIRGHGEGKAGEQVFSEVGGSESALGAQVGRDTAWRNGRVRSQLRHPFGVLGVEQKYDFQVRQTTYQVFASLEEVLATDLQLEVQRAREALSDDLARLLRTQVRTYTLRATTRLPLGWAVYGHYSFKEVEEIDELFSSYEWGVDYRGYHDCWGLRFSRHKPFAFTELTGEAPVTYRLQLQVIIGPSSFETPNIFS